MGNWHTADHGWSRYWSNGPEEVAKALAAPAVPVYGVRTLKDMDRNEIEAIEARYCCQISGRENLPAFRTVWQAAPDERVRPAHMDLGRP